ncbi:MAG: cytochrome c oxidase accessory protein CcoG [Piscirickettsiaceae bacterium]|nr:cytochrome c oxidase accessory protein CcoG [Piscirickettsiaceae bacterium]
MSDELDKITNNVDDLYEDVSEWEVNAGGIKIVAKRIAGKFRRLKWIGMSVWIPFFLGPYLRWDDRQAILFDLPNRQFNIFQITIYPQDIWMLSLTMLFFAILLATVTSIAGRVFCGYFCFQTVWTDIYTFIEAKLEGNTPQKAKKFNNAPGSLDKFVRKVIKHSLWLLIGILTGVAFVAWFTDIYQLWIDLFSLQVSSTALIIIATFTGGTYLFAGFMREQVCFWLCPYARLQAVMYDQDTLLPSYDAERGEPRGRIKKGQDNSATGSCIDCNVCVAVCPTGIDIRKGQQEGCITCGICIDACDSVMDKVKQPHGLIRYASYKELHHNAPSIPLYKRFRIYVYGFILLLSVAAIINGFMNLSPTEFKVVHSRQPLFVQLSDGSIQNKYTIKLLNKTKETLTIKFSIEGLEGAVLHGLTEITVEPGKVIPVTALVRVPEGYAKAEPTPIIFRGKAINSTINVYYKSMFIGPKK